MLADLFRTAFRNLIRDMKYQLERSGQKRGINAVAAKDLVLYQINSTMQLLHRTGDGEESV